MNLRGFVGVGVGVGVVAIALVAGYLIGNGGTTGPAERDRARKQTAPVALNVQVLQPPDASELDASGVVVGDETSAAPVEQHRLSGCVALPGDLELCEHGSQDPPPGVDVRKLPAVAQLKARRFGTQPKNGRFPEGPTSANDETQVVTPEEVARAAEVPCIGDGSSGPRVQAVYAHASDVASRYTEVLPLLQQYAADVSDRLNYAAGRSGQGRVVRYVTTGSACVLDVANVTLSSTGDDTFANMVTEMRARGYNRTDRKYLVWVDAAVGICGIAHVFKDDKPTMDNANTRGNMFARADAPCWGYAELHELLHTLGAVQDSAPNSTRAGHCHDETDTMCYKDTSGTEMKQTCTNEPVWNVDCRLDDYFNAAPAPGSYLDARWNAAENPYLQVTAPPPPLPGLTIASKVEAFAGNAWRVTAEPDLAEGTSVASFQWTSSRSDCRFDEPSALTTRYWCPVTAATGGRVRAWLEDSNRAETTRSQDYQLKVPAAPRSVTLSLTQPVSTIGPGQTVTLESRLSDATNGNTIIGMPVSLYRQPAGATSWEKIATKTTSSTGRTAFAVRPARTTTYRVASGSTSTWTNGTSATVRMKVR